MNIYVGNLAYKVKEADLRGLFENYGSVNSIKIITDKMTGRSKGFGFVEMPDDGEARAAINALHGIDLMGRNLNLSQSLPK